jgi:amino acid transporter
VSATQQIPVPAEGSSRVGGYRPELRRTLGFRDLVVYGLVFMVPIAPFGIFGSVYTASGGMVALAYVIGMVAMLFTAASYAQMVKAFPLAGSVYNYAGVRHEAPVSRVGVEDPYRRVVAAAW